MVAPRNALPFVIALSTLLAASALAHGQELDWDAPWTQSNGDLVRDVPRVNNPQLSATVGAAFGAVRRGEPDVDTVKANSAPQLRVSYLHPVATVVAVGGALHRTAYESDTDEELGTGDSFVHGLSLVGELRYPMRGGVVPFLRAALGPSLSILATSDGFESFREDADPSIGFHMDFALGFQSMTARHFGLTFGLRVEMDWIDHEVALHPRDSAPVSSYDVSYSLTTLGVFAGFVVPL